MAILAISPVSPISPCKNLHEIFETIETFFLIFPKIIDIRPKIVDAQSLKNLNCLMQFFIDKLGKGEEERKNAREVRALNKDSLLF